MTVELNTIAPKKWLDDFSGAALMTMCILIYGLPAVVHLFLLL